MFMNRKSNDIAWRKIAAAARAEEALGMHRAKQEIHQVPEEATTPQGKNEPLMKLRVGILPTLLQVQCLGESMV